MKNTKKLLAAGLAAMSIVSVMATSAFAAPTYDYYNYIGSGQSLSTGEMKKDNNGNTYNGQWRFRVKGSKADGVVITMRGDLRRGSISLGPQDARENKGSVWRNNSGWAGNNVHLSAKRVDMQKACTVWGDWSSDRT